LRGWNLPLSLKSSDSWPKPPPTSAFPGTFAMCQTASAEQFRRSRLG